MVVTTAATTALITYKIASKRIEAEYAQKIDDELEATRAFYAAFQEKPKLADLVEEVGLEPAVEDPDALVEKYFGSVDRYLGNDTPETALVQYNRITPTTPEPESEPQVVNLFENVAVTEVLPQEMVDARTEEAPYIITQEEFTEGDFPADTFTYYAEDGTLADSQSMPVDDVDKMLGEANVQQFGMGSGDPRIVYIRNEKLGMDFEIVAENGSYAKIVHGLGTDDHQESRRRRSPKDE